MRGVGWIGAGDASKFQSRLSSKRPGEGIFRIVDGSTEGSDGGIG